MPQNFSKKFFSAGVAVALVMTAVLAGNFFGVKNVRGNYGLTCHITSVPLLSGNGIQIGSAFDNNANANIVDQGAGLNVEVDLNCDGTASGVNFQALNLPPGLTANNYSCGFNDFCMFVSGFDSFSNGANTSFNILLDLGNSNTLYDINGQGVGTSQEFGIDLSITRCAINTFTCDSTGTLAWSDVNCGSANISPTIGSISSWSTGSAQGGVGGQIYTLKAREQSGVGDIITAVAQCPAAPVCPSIGNAVILTPPSIPVAQTSTASAPAGFTNGSFSSANPVVATITSGNILSGLAGGTSGITGSGWNYSNGAANCSLSATTLTVTAAPSLNAAWQGSDGGQTAAPNAAIKAHLNFSNTGQPGSKIINPHCDANVTSGSLPVANLPSVHCTTNDLVVPPPAP